MTSNHADVIAAAALFAHDRKCCVCRDEMSATNVQIHHIDGDHGNNAIENLSVLCLRHHNETQTHGGFTRQLTSDVVRLYRDDWVQTVALQRAQSTPHRMLRLDASGFVRDVTIPDGTVFAPATDFVKTWEIRNVGGVLWTGRRLVRLFTEDGPFLPRSPPSVAIPETPPGRTVRISVPMTAPVVPGTSLVQFKMTSADGALCFPERYPFGLAVLIHTEPVAPVVGG
jgi:hypothetical protein